MTEPPAEERRDLFPRPPASTTTTDFIVIVFTIMVATILILLTIAVILAGVFQENDPKPYFAVLTDIMTTVIGALVGYMAGKGSGRAEADELSLRRAEHAAQRQHEWEAERETGK